MKLLLLFIGLMVIAASAADISGNWKGTAQTPNGILERTFTFKTDGHTVTGETTSQMFGKSTIMDGKIEGDTLSFWVTIKIQGNEAKVNYKGKINPNGNEIKLTAETQDREFTVEYVAIKVS